MKLYCCCDMRSDISILFHYIHIQCILLCMFTLIKDLSIRKEIFLVNCNIEYKINADVFWCIFHLTYIFYWFFRRLIQNKNKIWMKFDIFVLKQNILNLTYKIVIVCHVNLRWTTFYECFRLSAYFYAYSVLYFFCINIMHCC